MPKSALRVLNVLEALASEQRAMSHAELAAHLGIPKSSLTGLLADLVERRYVVYDSERRRYGLGSQLLVLAKGYLEPLSLVRVGAPVLTRIVGAVNESAALSVLEGDQMLVLAQETCSQPLAHTMTIGTRSPLHSTASGKILLALATGDRRQTLLDSLPLPRMARHTLLDRARLRAEIDRVADARLAASDEEAIDGVYALGVPIFADGHCVAALSVAGPASRITEAKRSEIIEALGKGADEIGRNLSG